MSHSSTSSSEHRGSPLGLALRAAAFAAIQVVLLAALWRHGSTLDRNYLAASIDKHELLRRTPPPRLVFIGGSNLAFGLDSELLARELPLPPVNLGLASKAGLPFTLAGSKGQLAEGDIAVLCFEYEMFWQPPDPATQARLVMKRPASVVHLEARGLRDLLDRLWSELGFMAGAAIAAARGGEAQSSQPMPYTRGAVNERGDHVAHHGLASPRGDAYWSFDLVAHPERVATMVRHLDRWHDDVRARGVRAFLMAPPLPRDVHAERREDLDAVMTALERDCSIPLILSQAEVTFAAEDFYDSDYHLDREGAAERTARVIAALRERVLTTGEGQPR